jgi:putative membrane protein
LPLLHIATGGPDWFQWSVQLDVLLLCVALEWAYLWAVTSLRYRVPDAGRVKRTQVAFFTAGVIAIYIADGGPLHDLADGRLVSAHMFQHLVLMMVVPPLFLAGIPSWIWQALLRNPGILAAGKFITRPLVALAIFNGVFFMSHIPEAIDLQIDSWIFHLGVHISQVAAGLVMWWLVLSPVQELPKLSYPYQMAFLFLQSLIPSVFAGVLTFAHGAVYDSYHGYWGISITEDQQMSAAIMKITGTLILWSFMGYAFFRWYADEEAEARGPRWSEVEEELQELGLSARR